MTESIDKTFKYGSYIEDPVLTNSTVETGIGGLLRLYKSRTGQAAKNRPRRIWISKTRYYIDKELTQEQLEKALTYKRKLKEYQAAKAAGKKDLVKSYLDSIKHVKDDLKALRRALVKRDDSIIHTSGEIKKTLRVTSQDKFLWQYIRRNAVYMYSELIQVKDVSETGETYILNEIYNDYYKLNREQAAYLYNYIEQLLKQGKARTK